MTRPRHSIDGFVPRRPAPGVPINRYEKTGNQAGVLKSNPQSGFLERRRSTERQASAAAELSGLERSNVSGLSRTDIHESLQGIDDELPQSKKKGRGLRFGRPQSIKRLIKRLAIFLVVVGIIIGGWLGYKALSNASGIFEGNLFGLTQRQPLKQDANGRSNVLIFGTSEDNPDHVASGAGALLTDSMMVLSVNQEKKDAFMVSIPRDLWVKFDEPCSVGWQEKINSVYQCGSDFGEDPAAGAAALQKKVGEVLGLDIQYYGQINYSVVTQSVDAVGGVDVTIESNPSGVGILDRNFDWKCNYQCHYVKYEDGEEVHLDGEHALALSRARNAQGGYGLAGGNFDREKNQQKILKGLQEKALSLGTLTNINKVTELLDAMGENLKTNVDTSEVQTIMALATEIQSDTITSLDLHNEEQPLVTTGPVGSASAVYPVAGLFEYDQIHEFINKAASMDPATKEGATIHVLNGSGVFGAAQKEADWLEDQELTIGAIDNAPEGDYPETKIYQKNLEMPATKAKLESLYGVEVETASPMPIEDGVDFVVILGDNHTSREEEE